MAKKTRVLTEMQRKFLDALFDEAEGDYRLALKIAGYSEGSKPWDVVESLREEIHELTMRKLTLAGPKAAAKLIKLLDSPNEAGAVTIIKVAQEVLNRSGAVAKTSDIDLKVPQGGLIIMPAKKSSVAEDDDEVV